VDVAFDQPSLVGLIHKVSPDIGHFLAAEHLITLVHWAEGVHRLAGEVRGRGHALDAAIELSELFGTDGPRLLLRLFTVTPSRVVAEYFKWLFSVIKY
jgi:hypothetical protein